MAGGKELDVLIPPDANAAIWYLIRLPENLPADHHGVRYCFDFGAA